MYISIVRFVFGKNSLSKYHTTIITRYITNKTVCIKTICETTDVARASMTAIVQ